MKESGVKNPKMFKNLLGSTDRKEEALKTMDTDSPKVVTCVEPECSAQFELNTGEIDFYAARGLELPKRCKPCRVARSQSPLAYKTIQKAKQDYVLSDVVCQNCNKPATVPFEPDPGKPVYCKICWEGIKNLPLSAQR